MWMFLSNQLQLDLILILIGTQLSLTNVYKYGLKQISIFFKLHK